ncbi:Kiwa anti-phage protein KwaB-like domain-containing protein [Clostridium perfringens]|uniref:DUF4868 domain-containing protein n=1 Tax=Clostridium perfringens F262 TaxID=883064 RepID=A0AAV3FDY3_CLOPF|nr:Kiwa anti-phage protein KwaB-like domain-containing protein [Clostridium perfringens]EIA17472.1 hypothetical protein HA1_06502 [Clostridium perfringens F262]MDM0592772.1 DUF4868 domain-containing protein [Clostridium perfringens]MDM0595771.1 DUF4868 domain-containing protein [Clostridium perfringens]MDU1256340.1 DUF4868 domain-containing protein [Clostridium perfringens]MDU1966448.1 DUF4868 domain-containing protein [Clostridium perfringens]
MFNLDEAREFLREVEGFDLDCIFISKEYELKKALLQENLKNEIIENLINRFNKITKEKNVVEYDPIVKLEDSIDSISIEDVSKLNLIEENLKAIEAIEEIQSFDEIYDSRAYVMILKKDDMNLMFFKKFISSIYLKSKMKLLWLEGRMERLDKDIISIDDKFDCVGFSNNLLVISKPAFEQIFDYKDEYTKKANENIEHMNKLSIIKNIELLAMECEKVTIKKKLAKIKKDQIEWFKDQIENNFNRVEHIIDKAGLDIQVIEGELNINDVSELIHLIQNDYLKSEIDDENYIADSKRPIKQ